MAKCGPRGCSCLVGSGCNLPDIETQIPCCNATCATCVGAEELVLMEDGTSKRAGDLVSGDNIVGMRSDGSVATQTVEFARTAMSQAVRVGTRSGSFVASTTHVVVTDKLDEVRVTDLQPNDHALLTSDLAREAVISVVPIGEQAVINIHCVPDHTYFASGYLQHNKVAPMDPVPGPDL